MRDERQDRARLEGIILSELTGGRELGAILYRIHREMELIIRSVSISAKIIFAMPPIEGEDIFDFFRDVPKEEVAAFFASNEPTDRFSGSKTAMICPVTIDQNPIGTITVDSMGPDYSREFMALAAKRISQLCGRLFNKDIYMASSGSLFNSFLAQYIFLSGTVAESDNTGEIVQSLIAERRLRPPYVFLAFKSAEGRDELLVRAEADIERHVPGALHLVGNGCLYVFLSLRPGQQLDRESSHLRWINSFCFTYNLRCAISPAFGELSDRSFYKKLVCSVLEKVSGGENITFIDEQYSRIIYSRAMEALGRDGMVLREAVLLKEYDRVHNTGYLETLKVYLANCNRLSAASKELFIDHSTMLYRLKKISSVIGIDMEEPENAARLRCCIAAQGFNGFK